MGLKLSLLKWGNNVGWGISRTGVEEDVGPKREEVGGDGENA
jgi:hypothetical protein